MTRRSGWPSRSDQDARADRAERAPLPINPETGHAYPPGAHPGFYPGYSTLAQRNFWDEATRTVVLARVFAVPPLRFFRDDEVAIARAVFERIIPQDDRDEAHTIPILNYVDSSYYEDQTPGYRYAGMPPDREAIRLGLKGIEAIARQMFGKPFTELAPREQEMVLQTLHDGAPPAGAEYWRQMDVRTFWLQLVGRAIDAYYAHPYAWDEIGFGGPAYPRGYMRLREGRAEPWEVAERRYSWAPPPGMPSAVCHPLPPSEQGTQPPTPGQGGTH